MRNLCALICLFISSLAVPAAARTNVPSFVFPELPPKAAILIVDSNCEGKASRFDALFSGADLRPFPRSFTRKLFPLRSSDAELSAKVYYYSSKTGIGMSMSVISPHGFVCNGFIAHAATDPKTGDFFALTAQDLADPAVSRAVLRAKKNREDLCALMTAKAQRSADLVGMMLLACGNDTRDTMKDTTPDTEVVGLTIGNKKFAIVSNWASVYVVLMGR